MADDGAAALIGGSWELEPVAEQLPGLINRLHSERCAPPLSLLSCWLLVAARLKRICQAQSSVPCVDALNDKSRLRLLKSCDFSYTCAEAAQLVS